MRSQVVAHWSGIEAREGKDIHDRYELPKSSEGPYARVITVFVVNCV